MLPQLNPYIAWMRDRSGELSPTEEVVATHLPALAQGLRDAHGPARRRLGEALAERRLQAAAAEAGAAPESAPPVTALVWADEAAVDEAVTEALLQGACGELDRLAGDPARAAYLEAALRYAVAGESGHALEPPPDAPPERSAVTSELEARLAANAGLEPAVFAALAEEAASRGRAIARRVLFAEDPGLGPDERLPPAGFWRRAGAYTLDNSALKLASTVTALVVASLAGVTDEGAYTALAYLGSGIALFAGAITLAAWGSTPGRIALGLEVRRVADGRRLGFAGAVLRQFVGEIANLLFCGAGIWSSRFRDDHRTWADLVSRSEVVEAPRPLPVRRALLTALVLAAVGEYALLVSLKGLDTKAEALEGDVEQLFTRSATLADSSQLLFTREVESKAEYVSDLRGLLPVLAESDSLLRLERRHAAVYRANWLLAPVQRRYWAGLDSLLTLRLERSALMRRWAREGLGMAAADSLDPAPFRRRMRYLSSDVHALEQRMAPLSERLSRMELR